MDTLSLGPKKGKGSLPDRGVMDETLGHSLRLNFNLSINPTISILSDYALIGVVH